MKVVHVIPNLDIRGGGGNRACAELCESLAKKTIRISLVFNKKGNEPEFVSKGVKIIRCRHLILEKYGFSIEMIYHLWREIRTASLLHIHALWRFSGIAAACIAYLLKIPYIVQPHGSLHPWKLNYKKKGKRIYAFFIERHVLANAAAIHVESEDDRDDIFRFCPGSKTVLVPCGVYASVFNKGQQNLSNSSKLRPYAEMKNTRWILYLARLDVNKGIDLLVQAFKEIAEKYQDTNLMVIGPDFSGCWDKIKERNLLSGIEDRVSYLGMVSDEDRVGAYLLSDFYVLPSLSENFGISVVEALISSRPVLTTNKTPWAVLERVGAGFVVEPTVNDIKQGLMKMLSLSNTKKKQMADLGRKYAMDNFEWSAVADKMIQYYQNVLDGKL